MIKKTFFFGVCFSSAIFLYFISDLSLSFFHKKDISGIDISHHNKIENWQILSSELSFCIMKSTQGSSYKDPTFQNNWSKTKKLGLVRGAYHFFQPGISATKQFENFKKNVYLSKGDLPPILDVELKECDMDEVVKWLELAEKHYGVKPILYSDYFFFKILMYHKIPKKYPLWLYLNENYGFNPSFRNFDCKFWQYNQHGKKNGAVGDIDLNYFLGDFSDLEKMLVK